MSELTTIIPSLKNAVAPPGQFDELYPDADDIDLLIRLLDAFGEAQLDGYLSTTSVDDAGTALPDLSRAANALLVLYAAKRVIEMRLLNMKTHVRYEAGPAVFEEDQGASTLVALLKEMSARLKELRDLAREGNYSSGFLMADLYMIRATSTYDGMTDLGYDGVHILDALG